MHPHPPPTRTSPLPKSGEERLVYRLAALTRMVEPPGQKKRFSLAARHRFFGQAPKKWGRKAGQAIDHLPTYRRTRTNVKKRGKPLDRVFPLDPLPDLCEAQESSALCGARARAPPLHPAAFEKAGETFRRARSAQRSFTPGGQKMRYHMRGISHSGAYIKSERG